MISLNDNVQIPELRKIYEIFIKCLCRCCFSVGASTHYRLNGKENPCFFGGLRGWNFESREFKRPRLLLYSAALINLTKAHLSPIFSLQRRSGCGFLRQQRDQRRRVPADLLAVQRQPHAGRRGQSGRYNSKHVERRLLTSLCDHVASAGKHPVQFIVCLFFCCFMRHFVDESQKQTSPSERDEFTHPRRDSLEERKAQRTQFGTPLNVFYGLFMASHRRTQIDSLSTQNLSEPDTHRHTQTHTDTHRHTQTHTLRPPCSSVASAETKNRLVSVLALTFSSVCVRDPFFFKTIFICLTSRHRDAHHAVSLLQISH